MYCTSVFAANIFVFLWKMLVLTYLINVSDPFDQTSINFLISNVLYKTKVPEDCVTMKHVVVQQNNFLSNHRSALAEIKLFISVVKTAYIYSV